MSNSRFVYVTYIKTTPERLWFALTDKAFTQQYWLGACCESDWKPGSPWKLSFTDGRIADAGEIVEADPPRRLVIKWRNEWSPELKAEGYSLCTFEIETVQDAGTDAVKLSVIQQALIARTSVSIQAVSGGWPRILSEPQVADQRPVW